MEWLCFPGKECTSYEWKKRVAVRIRFTHSHSKSRADFLALHFGQTTTDTQWQRDGGAIVPEALRLCKQVQQHSFDFTSL